MFDYESEHMSGAKGWDCGTRRENPKQVPSPRAEGGHRAVSQDPEIMT